MNCISRSARPGSRPSSFSRSIRAAVALLVGFTPGLGLSDVIFVDPTAIGGNTGDSWKNAFTTLQAAIGDAANGDEIWVAAGTYFPDEGPEQTDNSRKSTFLIDKEVSLYGGFAGEEKQRSDRDPVNNPTILSGDLEQNDNDLNGDGIPDDVGGIAGDNAAAVVTLEGLKTDNELDGFRIGAGDGETGGGILSIGSEAVIRACRILNNRAALGGGGLAVDGGAPAIEDCRIQGNHAVFGGGLHVSNGVAAVVGTVIQDNFAQTDGGGVYFASDILRTIELDRCDLLSNTAGVGNGGGVWADRATLTAVNCRARGNSAGVTGGGFYYSNTDARLINVLVAGNSAATLAGGIANGAGSVSTLENATLVNNRANHLSAFSGGSSTFVHLVAWDNDTILSSTDDVAPANTFLFSLVEDVDLSGSNGNFNGILLVSDPLFLDATPVSAPTVGGHYRLQPSSPCIDAGDDSLYSGPPTDLDGGARFWDGNGDTTATIDLGAYEFSASVDADTDGDGLPDIYETANTTPASATSLDPYGNPDLDDRITLLEFAMGPDPQAFDPGSGLWIARNGGGIPVLNHGRSRFASAYVDLVLQENTYLPDAGGWTTARVSESTVPVSPDVDTVVSTVAGSALLDPRIAYRLRATLK